jgi:HlyD family secretion protein
LFAQKKNHASFNLKGAAILAMAVFGGFFLWYEHDQPPLGFLGYVEGEFVRVASPIAGTLVNRPIKQGMNISQGAPLFTLERENEIAARDEALRRYERTKFELENIKIGKRPEEIEVIADTLAQAEADQKFARLFLERQEKLIATKATSIESLDRARSNYNHGEARIAELKAQLKVANLPGREMEIKAAQQEMEAAHAILRQAQWRLDQKSITSPVTGFVFDALYVVGEWVPAGSPIAVILPPENIKVRFFVPENKLGSFKLGQAITIQYDGQEKNIPATISYISPTAEYTPPVIYSREWRSKLMYMLEAHPIEATNSLHPGQPVEIVIGTP